MKHTSAMPVLMLLSILNFSSLVTPVDAFQERRREDGWRLFPRDVAHWFGYFGFVLLAVSAAYSGLKRGFPQNIKLWLTIHCIPGILSLLFTGIHIVNKILHLRPGMILSFLTFILMAIIVVGGIIGRYTKMLSNYWRTFHIPLTALFYVLLVIHLVDKASILAS